MKRKAAITASAALPALLVLASCATTDERLDRSYVTDFESCVAAGYQILEGTPRRCLQNGQLFVEGG